MTCWYLCTSINFCIGQSYFCFIILSIDLCFSMSFFVCVFFCLCRYCFFSFLLFCIFVWQLLSTSVFVCLWYFHIDITLINLRFSDFASPSIKLITFIWYHQLLSCKWIEKNFDNQKRSEVSFKVLSSPLYFIIGFTHNTVTWS